MEPGDRATLARSVAESRPKIDFSVFQVSKHQRMPLVEMFVVNLHPVRRRLLMDKTLKISFVRQEGDTGAVLEENIGGSNPKKVDNHFRCHPSEHRPKLLNQPFRTSKTAPV